VAGCRSNISVAAPNDPERSQRLRRPLVQNSFQREIAMFYVFSTLDDNVAINGTELTGINDSGEIVGYFRDANYHAFSFLNNNNNFLNKTDPNPNATDTFLFGVNNLGQAVGAAVYVNDPVHGSATWGYFFTVQGAPLTVQPYLTPHGFLVDTTLRGINNLGAVVGHISPLIQGGFTEQGFFLPPGYLPSSPGGQPNGVPIPINFPYAGANAGQGTIPSGVNDAGTIVGTYIDGNGVPHGFTFIPGNLSPFTTLDVPSSVTTAVSGINNAGQIVGNYTDFQDGDVHGFVYDAGVYYTFDYSLSVNGTYASGINDAGTIVGCYVDDNNQVHGFVAAPQPTGMMLRRLDGTFETYNIESNRIVSRPPRHWGSPSRFRRSPSPTR
jgi:uncharacterized membrane protein